MVRKATCMSLLLVVLLSGLVSAAEWYEGGTLHRAKVAEWKDATARNKLATCADFIAKMRNSLDLPITTVDSIKPYAQELVDFIDAATDGVDEMDEESVASMAAMGTIMMGWGKD
jgi:hypothetical protein